MVMWGDDPRPPDPGYRTEPMWDITLRRADVELLCLVAYLANVLIIATVLFT